MITSPEKRAYDREWRKANPERVRAHDRARYERDKAKRAEAKAARKAAFAIAFVGPPRQPAAVRNRVLQRLKGSNARGRGKPPALPTLEKTCAACSQCLPVGCFSRKGGAGSDARFAYCKPCHAVMCSERRARKTAERYEREGGKTLPRSAEWKAANPEKVEAHEIRKKAVQRARIGGRKFRVPPQATPGWADMARIADFYEEAVWLGKLTGEPHHVDHIVPLLSDTVCGLHNHFNLQTIPAKDNCAKGNRVWPDMP